MSGEVETCNGGDALESNCTINCFKSEALDYSTGIGVGRDAGKGRTGSSDVFRTYKRRRRATTVSDSKPHDDGRASATLACQLADQGGRKDNVLQNMYQSLSDDEGGIQGCIRDALAFHPVTGCMDNLKEPGASDKVGLKSLLETKKLANGVPNGTRVGAVENGPSHGSIHCTVTEKCRNTFLNILKSEKFSALTKLLSENFQGIKADRLLNMKIISSKMKDGAYEHSPMFFLDDVQQVWKTIQTVGSEMTSTARSLSDTSRTLFNEQFGMEQADVNVKLEKSEACSMYEVCTCRHCGDKADGANFLVCDSCEEVYHISCIEPSVENTPPKSWYCTRCTARRIRSLHKNCVVCDRLDFPSSHIDQSCDDVSTDGGPQLFDGSRNLGICKICGNNVRNLKKSVICEHPYCPNKYYHASCLTNKQKKSYGPNWYCFSCLCRLCLTDRDDESIVLCDSCDNAYHIYCMIPPRASIPEGKWFCRKCDTGIGRIRTARRVYERIEKKQKTISEECVEGSDKVKRNGHALECCQDFKL